MISSVLFLVYPGTERDRDTYIPRWARRHMRSVFPIGLMWLGREFGLVGATQATARQMEDGDVVRSVLDDCLAEFPLVEVVALAGRIPGLAKRAGIELSSPFVEGARGTRYAMIAAGRALASKAGKDPSELCIAVPGGAGFIGSQLAGDLAKEFKRVIAIDPRHALGPSQSIAGLPAELLEKISATADPAAVAEADVVLVLTASGDDIENLVPFMRSGTILGDDTHPPIHKPLRTALVAKGVDLWKATMVGRRLRMFPRLPNFRGSSIPGCLLEALVVYYAGREVLHSQEHFNGGAEKLGFKVALIRHPEDE